MSSVLQCDRCQSQSDIFSTRKFASGIDVTVSQQNSPTGTHICSDCLSSAMLDAVLELNETPTTRDLIETKTKVADTSRAFAMVERITAERDEMKERLQDARNESTTASRYDGWLKERASLNEKIEALEAARDVALTRAATAEHKAADVVKRDAAAAKQVAVEDPQYVEAVAAREAKRASGR
jgi:hypothetical protein